MTDTASMAEAERESAPRSYAKLRRISAAEPAFGRIADFLTDEAALLDSDRYTEWLDLLTDDVSYQMPIRKSLYRRDGDGFDARMGYFDDDRMTLGIRVRRSLEMPSAFDRDPAPRMRRMISTVMAHESDADGTFAVSSSILLLRNRLSAPTYSFLSAQREDVLREEGGSLKLARRVILVDQATLGDTFINVFM